MSYQYGFGLNLTVADYVIIADPLLFSQFTDFLALLRGTDLKKSPATMSQRSMTPAPSRLRARLRSREANVGR